MTQHKAVKKIEKYTNKGGWGRIQEYLIIGSALLFSFHASSATMEREREVESLFESGSSKRSNQPSKNIDLTDPLRPNPQKQLSDKLDDQKKAKNVLSPKWRPLEPSSERNRGLLLTTGCVFAVRAKEAGYQVGAHYELSQYVGLDIRIFRFTYEVSKIDYGGPLSTHGVYETIGAEGRGGSIGFTFTPFLVSGDWFHLQGSWGLMYIVNEARHNVTDYWRDEESKNDEIREMRTSTNLKTNRHSIPFAGIEAIRYFKSDVGVGAYARVTGIPRLNQFGFNVFFNP